MWSCFSSSLVLISYQDQNDSVKEDHQVTGCCYGKNYPRGASPGDSTPSSGPGSSDAVSWLGVLPTEIRLGWFRNPARKPVERI